MVANERKENEKQLWHRQSRRKRNRNFALRVEEGSDNNAKYAPLMSKPAGPLPLAELPVGPKPDWELENDNDEEETEEKQSIPERYVSFLVFEVSLTSPQLCNSALTSTMSVTLYVLNAPELNIMYSARTMAVFKLSSIFYQSSYRKGARSGGTSASYHTKPWML